jgi:hypothetical protein
VGVISDLIDPWSPKKEPPRSNEEYELSTVCARNTQGKALIGVCVCL